MSETPNLLFPGHRNDKGKFDYEGPFSGYFSLLHHYCSLAEWSYNVMERVRYIVTDKPEHEQDIRLRHIVFLGDKGVDYATKHAKIHADFMAKCAPFYNVYKTECLTTHNNRLAKCYAAYTAACAPAYADYEAKCATVDAEIIDYIKPLIDGFTWNGKELVF